MFSAAAVCALLNVRVHEQRQAVGEGKRKIKGGECCSESRWLDEVLDDEMTTCYVKLKTGEVRYEKPPRWVRTMAKMFSNGSNNNRRNFV